jgi:hypothetical protein
MAGSKRIARIPVCLNKEDPYQKELINHIKSYTNASAYLKSLVIRDYEDKKKKVPNPRVINGGKNTFNGFVLEA